jgi:hypothetical protein
MKRILEMLYTEMVKASLDSSDMLTQTEEKRLEAEKKYNDLVRAYNILSKYS